METEYDDDSVIRQTNGDRSAQIIQIDNGKAIAAVAICAAFAALGVGLSVHATYTAQQSAMETRILQQHVLELEAKHSAEEARDAQ